MSAYHYVRGHREYKCDDCGAVIPWRGSHLYWRSAIEKRYLRICERCSVSLTALGCPKYGCHAVTARLAREAHAAALRAKYPKP